MRAALLAIAVGLVLADSSVVTLGLPDVLADFDASPERVAWVLTAYNLVLALAAVPAATWLLRGGDAPLGSDPARVLALGLLVFAAASLACALAPSLGFLVFARCVQGLGGAAVACAALPLLVDATGDRRGATAIWGAAGATGAAVGPAAGGALTDALSWEAIFAVQVPLALVCIVAARVGGGGAARVEGGDLAARVGGGGAARVEGGDLAARGGAARVEAGGAARVEAGGAARVEGGGAAGAGRPAWAALAALAFLGAGLTAALFLPVLLLIAGWRHSPLAAAAAVSAMPAAALAAGVLGRGIDERTRGASGAILCAGGLAALGLLPGSSVAWLIAPQVLIGLGLGFAVTAVTEGALRDRLPLALHGGWAIAARHAGVVTALAILTPIFTSDLEDRTERAQEIVLARILDSPIAPATKLDLGLGLAQELRATEGEVPDIGPAFAEAVPGNEDRPAFDTLRADVADQLDRASASAFERSFLVAALLAALAVVPLLAPRPKGVERIEDGAG